MNLIRLISILTAAGYLSAGPIYTLADLGNLGGTSAMATALNSFGQAVGTATTPTGDIHAFTSSGAGLTDLTANSNASYGQAQGINNAGQIAGTQYFGGQTYASVWNNGVATTVGGAGSYAMAINNSGNVAGMLIRNGQGNAFVSSNGTVIDLGTFAGGLWSAAYSLNDSGQAAGYGMTSNGNFRAFVWTPGQGYAVLGTLGGAGSYAMSINNSGRVAGSSQLSSGYLRAITSNGTSLQNLGTLGGVSSSAYGINNQGNVVGNSFTTANAAEHGFLEEGGVMWDINSLLIDAPGWVVTSLYAINDSNQIAGVGLLNGVEHAVLLTDPPAPESSVISPSTITPEPATWLGASSVLLGLFLRLRSTRRARR